MLEWLGLGPAISLLGSSKEIFSSIFSKIAAAVPPSQPDVRHISSS